MKKLNLMIFLTLLTISSMLLFIGNAMGGVEVIVGRVQWTQA